MSRSDCIRMWRCRLVMALAVLSPILLALLLARLVPPAQEDPFSPVLLEPVVAASSPQLEALFARHGYDDWPPQSVPALAVRTLPPDLAALPVQERKGLFFRSLLPLVVAENTRLWRLRGWLLQLQQRGEEDYPPRLRQLAREYRIDPQLEGEQLLAALLRRVDVVPTGLVLAQAANESGWGTSRFSREGNNLFGEWTWDAARGIVPKQRAKGAQHYVRRFESLRASVRSYMHNLNSGHAYARLRGLRAQLRAQGREPDALVLAGALERYSARGSAYVEEIRAMIRGNRLSGLGPLGPDR